MKKIFAFVSAVALLASCTSKENGNTDPIVPEVKLVPITVKAGVDTKATIGEMKWEAGDKITVWVKSDVETNPNYKGYELEIDDVDLGTFYGEIAYPQETDTYYAAYGATGFDKANMTPVFAIPSEQNDAAEGATKVMLGGKVTGGRQYIEFQMTAATAKLSITVNEDVKKVEFAGMNGEKIAENDATVISYEGDATRNIQLVVPAIEFSKGYTVTYTNNADQKMYQSYESAGYTFEAGKVRAINCTFVPFSISCAIDADNAPKTSYDYYLAGNLTKANSADFETVGRLSDGPTEQPWVYDEDAQGVFTGKIERGKAKVVINGASSRVIPTNLTIKEYGCYVKRVGGQEEGKDVYETAQSIALTKDFTWDVLYKQGEAATHMIEVDAGDLELKPYIIVNDGTKDTEYKAPDAYTLHVTGLPHRSDHKDLWYFNPSSVSGQVKRHEDEKDYPVDMFEMPFLSRGQWRDFAVRTRHFNIPAETNAKVIMHGTLWAPHSINAYFWFDATNDSFVLHKDVDKTREDNEKLKNLSDCDAYDEESQARTHTAYEDLGTTYGHVNDNTITLSPANPAASIYLWIHRGTTMATDTAGYWCRWIKVQYAEAAQNN